MISFRPLTDLRSDELPGRGLPYPAPYVCLRVSRAAS